MKLILKTVQMILISILVMNINNSSGFTNDQNSNLILPTMFNVNQTNPFSSTFRIRSIGDDQNLGTISKKFLALALIFDYYNEQNYLIARAKEISSFGGIHIEVFDDKGIKLGSIKKETLRSILTLHNTILILDKNETLSAKSRKFEIPFLPIPSNSIPFYLQDQENPIATVKRLPINPFGDSWTVVNNNPEIIDPRILIMVGPIKTQSECSAAFSF